MGILRTNTVSGIETPTPVTGSVLFDGSGDFLSLADSNDWHFSSGNFTAEMWAYPTASPAQAMLIGQWSGSGGSTTLGWAMMLSNDSNRYLRALMSSTGSGVDFDLVSSASLGLNQWNHCAFVKNGSTFTLYLNGINVASTTDSDALFDATNALTIGATSAGTQAFQGYISNVRVLKGTALYTANFTPPTRELQPIGDTVLLCCNNPDSAGAEATGKAITVNGNAAASTFSPGLVRNFTFGTQFDGVSKFDTQGYFVPPSGTTEQRSRGRGLFGGGFATGNVNTLEYITITSSGNGIDFGDLTQARHGLAACSSSTRGVFGGGSSPSFVNTVDYVTISSTANALDFGDLLATIHTSSACASSTRGVWGGGLTPSSLNTIQYITIASLGNAVSFGSLTQARYGLAACSSSTRGVFGGGDANPISNTIDYVTIASTGNAIDFGDLTQVTIFSANSSCSSSVRGLWGGGLTPTTPTIINVINYITIASTGNAIDFGDLIGAKRGIAACSSTARGIFGGGELSSNSNLIEYVTIASTGNATDFGDLIEAKTQPSACSDSHGGLS